MAKLGAWMCRAASARDTAVRVVVVAILVAGCMPRGEALVDRLVNQQISPEQHWELAEQYRRRADNARNLAAYHAALAARYRGGAGDGSDDGTSKDVREGLASHCERLARAYEAAATEYQALAAEHQAHARSLAVDPLRPTRGH